MKKKVHYKPLGIWYNTGEFIKKGMNDEKNIDKDITDTWTNFC